MNKVPVCKANMKRLVLLLTLSVLVSYSAFARSIYPNSASVTPVEMLKISSGSIVGYSVGATTIAVSSVDKNLDLLLTNESTNSREIFWAYVQNFTTWTVTNGTERGKRLDIGATKRFEKFFGTIWLINGDKNSTASDVSVDKVRDTK